MVMNRLCRILFCFLCLTLAVGCGKSRPKDMPKTYPFKVKVVDGSRPIEEVHVVLIYDQSPAISGTTDKSGVAELYTTLQGYTVKGAPSGSFRVTCRKDPNVEHWKTAQERAEMNPGEASEYFEQWQAKVDAAPREVPKIWSDFDQTPLTLTITDRGGEVVFDVDGAAND